MIIYFLFVRMTHDTSNHLCFVEHPGNKLLPMIYHVIAGIKSNFITHLSIFSLDINKTKIQLLLTTVWRPSCGRTLKKKFFNWFNWRFLLLVFSMTWHLLPLAYSLWIRIYIRLSVKLLWDNVYSSKLYTNVFKHELKIFIKIILCMDLSYLHWKFKMRAFLSQSVGKSVKKAAVLSL